MNLLVVDDHILMLEGLVSLLRSESGFSVDVAQSGVEALEKINNTDYDVCLLDIGMPGMDGIATSKAIRQQGSKIKIIILTTYNDQAIVRELIDIGISGYVLKNSTKKELIDAITKVAAGETYFSAELENSMIGSYTTYRREKNQNETSESISLTQREKEILQLLAREFTNDAIAKELKISFRTVETHRKNMMQKTKSHNLAGLLKYAYREGLIA
jgi:DNA-binding NarL/FixJ family response regulator